MSFDINLRATDMADLNRELNRLAEQTGKTLKDVLPAQMRLLAADLAYVTYPKGKDDAQRTQHKNKILRRIADVYPHVGFIVWLLNQINPGAAGRFASLMKNRQHAKAQAITDKYLYHMSIKIGAFDGGALHRAQANQKNATRRLVCDAGDHVNARVLAYMKEVMQKSGFAKGGFATAARQLGGVRGIPGWATRQKSPGTGKITGDGVTLSVEMVNNVDYLRFAMKPNDEAAAVANRAKQVGLVLKRIQDRKVKQIMRNLQ